VKQQLSPRWNFFAAALWLLLSACAELPLLGVTVTNSPDTLPCAPGKPPGRGC